MVRTRESICVYVYGNLPASTTLSSHSAKNSWKLHEESSNQGAAQQLLRTVWLSYRILVTHSYFLLSNFILMNHLVVFIVQLIYAS